MDQGIDGVVSSRGKAWGLGQATNAGGFSRDPDWSDTTTAP